MGEGRNTVWPYYGHGHLTLVAYTMSFLSNHVDSFTGKEDLVISGIKLNKIQTSNHSLPDPIGHGSCLTV